MEMLISVLLEREVRIEERKCLYIVSSLLFSIDVF